MKNSLSSPPQARTKLTDPKNSKKTETCFFVPEYFLKSLIVVFYINLIFNLLIFRDETNLFF